MLKKYLLLVLLPVNILTMEYSKLSTNKLAFANRKIISMIEQLKNINDDLSKEQSNSERANALKVKYVQLSEKISEGIFTLIDINSKELLIQLKQTYQIDDKLILLLHSTDPALESGHAKNHEQLLANFTTEPKHTYLDDWAIEYDINCVANNISQRYGTLVRPDNSIELPVVGCSNPLRQEDYERINARRKRVGLPCLSQSTITNACEPCTSTPSV